MYTAASAGTTTTKTSSVVWVIGARADCSFAAPKSCEKPPLSAPFFAVPADCHPRNLPLLPPLAMPLTKLIFL